MSGTEILRDAVRFQVIRKSYGRTANAVGISNDSLLAFGEGRRELSADVLRKLAAELFQHVSFDEARNLLVAGAGVESRPLGSVPSGFIADGRSVLPGPHTAALIIDKVAEKPKARPGWLNSIVG